MAASRNRKLTTAGTAKRKNSPGPPFGGPGNTSQRRIAVIVQIDDSTVIEYAHDGGRPEAKAATEPFPFPIHVVREANRQDAAKQNPITSS